MSDLVCPACGRRETTGPTFPPRCPCGGLWRNRDQPDPVPGAGETPLWADPRRSGLWWKREDLQPTGSFKDRGAAVLAGIACEAGAASLVVDSSGSAALALAAAGAVRGLPVTVHVPAGVPATLADALRLLGAEVVAAGTREDAARRARNQAEKDFYASHVYHPAFQLGTARAGFEVLDQGGARTPRRWLVPVGNGSLFLGLAAALSRSRVSGIELIAVQARACAGLLEPGRGGTSAARGIAIADPPRREEIRTAIRDHGGRVVAVEEMEIERARDELGACGVVAERASAAALAAWERLRAEEPAEIPTVAFLTGSGLRELEDVPAARS